MGVDAPNSGTENAISTEAPVPPKESIGAPAEGRTRIWKWILTWLLIVLFLGLVIGLLIYFFVPRSHLADPSLRQGDFLPAYDERNTSNSLLLPGSMIPYHYNIRIETFLRYNNKSDLTFIGSVAILLNCTIPTNFIRFNSLYLDFVKDVVLLEQIENPLDPDSGTRSIPIESMTHNNHTQMMTLIVDAILIPGEIYRLTIAKYYGTIRTNDLRGFYLSSYKTATSKPRYLAATQFEVAEARKAFPCWDEPRFKATFKITIVRQLDMRSLSNMKRIGSERRGDDWVEDHFETTVKMSTYLVAFVVCDFQYKERIAHRKTLPDGTTQNGTQIRGFARPDLINETDHALDMSVKILNYFEDYFGIPYALDKLDLIALPDFSHGAMENWGLITFKEKTMLYNPDSHSRQQKEIVSMIVGHEIAHQWFGNLVTMHWWNDLWLNEGFAHYMGYVVAEKVDPEEPMEHVFIYANVLSALSQDSLTSTHPILTNVYHPDTIVTLFDPITYRKGSCLIRMMANFLGEDVLRHGLQIYLGRHSYGNTISQNLWEAVDLAVTYKSAQFKEERMANLSVSTIMGNWITLTGYPYVNFTRSYDGSRTAQISQARFVLNGNQSEPYDEMWYIPFTYGGEKDLNSNDPSPKLVWFNKSVDRVKDLPPKESWVVGNVDLNGFYRVNYDAQNWKLLVDQLRRNHTVISTSQRAQIIDDSFEFVTAELMDIRQAFNTTDYLSHEADYLPWRVALTRFRQIDAVIKGNRDYGLFTDYVQGLMYSVHDKMVWRKQAGEKKLDIYLRDSILSHACMFGKQSCLLKARQLYRNWMRNGTMDDVPGSLKSVVRCYGIQEGGTREWRFAWKEYQNATSSAYKAELLVSLGCTRNPRLIKQLVSWCSNPAIISRWHVSQIFKSLSKSLEGRKAAWEYVRKNWDRLVYNLKEIAGDFAKIFRDFNTEEELTEVEDFMRNHDLGPAGPEFFVEKEKLELNLLWSQRNTANLIQWFIDRIPKDFLVTAPSL